MMRTLQSLIAFPLVPTCQDESLRLHPRKVLRRLKAQPSIRAQDQDSLTCEIAMLNRERFRALVLDKFPERKLAHVD